jgi:hypothetical protein
LLTWLRHRRERSERIEFQAEALLYEFRGEAYNEACRRRDETGSEAGSEEWDRVALAIARKIGFHVSAQKGQHRLRPNCETEKASKSQTESTPRLVEKLNRVEVEDPRPLPPRPSVANADPALSVSSENEAQRRSRSRAGNEDVQPSTTANAAAPAPLYSSALAPRTATKRKRRQRSMRPQAETTAGAKVSAMKASP